MKHQLFHEDKGTGRREGEDSMYKKIKIGVMVVFIVLMLVLIKIFFSQQFDSVESVQNYMESFGAAGPLVLLVFQALQVVIPIVPGQLGCAAGSIAFGTMTGFWCNYIGVSLGSIAAYFLARRFGKDIVLAMFSEKQYAKWSSRVEKSKSYGRFLFLATILPLFPDDFLCYFSGLMKMDRKKFIWIIILGKPWCTLAYCIAFGMIQ